MANTKISQLTALTNPTGNEELVYAYNNSNGKMTVNTVKTFVGTGKQDTLVSGTNIKTINNQDILGSGNINISGTGDGQYTFDCVVDAAGNGDYTTVAAAMDAGSKSIYVKAGTYTESTWDATNRDVTIVGELGTVVNFASLTGSGTTSYVMRVTSGYSYHIEGIKFVVTSGNCFFSSYTVTRGSETIFKVSNCILNISSLTKMFYSGGVELSGNSGSGSAGVYKFNNGGVNGFENCMFNITSSSFGLSDTSSNAAATPYTRCIINASTSTLAGIHTVLEFSTVEAVGLGETFGAGNTITLSTTNGLSLEDLRDSRINLTSTFAGVLDIEDCSGLRIDIEGTPTKINIKGKVTDCKIVANDNATTVECKANVVSGCYFDLLVNGTTFILNQSDMAFVGNYIEMTANGTVTIKECRDCTGNWFGGALNIGDSQENTEYINFSNNYVGSASACSIYCTEGVISGNRFGTGGFKKDITFYSGASNNTFTGNIMSECTLNSGANYNVLVGNYVSATITNNGTGNVVADNSI